MKMKKLFGILLVALLLAMPLMGCSATDPITDDTYFEGTIYIWDGDSWEAVGAGGGTDEDAIHDNEAGEIAAIAEKGTPVAGDMLLIEDSEDGDAKKMLQIDNLPAGGAHTHDATEVDVSELGEATYDDAQDYSNFFGDRTLLSGGAISDNGDGTVTVALGTAWAKVTDSDTAVGNFFNFSADASVSLTDLTTNYIYIDYNAGTPQIVVATSILTNGFKQDHVLVGTAFRDGTTSHFHHVDTVGIGRIGRVDMHHREEEAVHRVDGIVTSSIGTRNLGITAGVLYEGLSRHDTSPFTTPNSGTADDTEANKLHDADGDFATTDVGKTVHNTTDDTYAEVTAFVDSGELTLNANIFINGENYDLDSFTYWYTTDSGSTWIEVRGSTTLSNSQYNDVTSGLSNLTANRYGIHWVYMEVDGEHFHVLYGQGNYKVNESEEATPPSISPNIVNQYCALVAKIIVQEGTDTLIIMFPWTTVFTSSFATDHGSLGGLADDDHIQYVANADFNAKGDLLSASADDTPLILGVGGDGEVLTADSGEATGLIWAPAGGGGVVEVFLSPRNDMGSVWVDVDDWFLHRIIDTEQVGFVWMVPTDFQSITSMEVILIPDASETITVDIKMSIATQGENYDDDTEDVLDQTLVVIINDLTEWDIGSLLSGTADFVAGDYVAINFESDTWALRVLGLKITYAT